MANISITEKGALLARGTLASTGTPPVVYIDDQNGPNWSDTVPPGDYQFSCRAGGAGGATVTVTVTDQANPGAALGTAKATIDCPSGTLGAAEVDVKFTVKP